MTAEDASQQRETLHTDDRRQSHNVMSLEVRDMDIMTPDHDIYYGIYPDFQLPLPDRLRVSNLFAGNTNGFYFNACPLGLTPDGTLCLSMLLYDPRTVSYVNDNVTIFLTQDINVQILYFLFPLMHAVQPHLHYRHNCCFPSRVHAL